MGMRRDQRSRSGSVSAFFGRFQNCINFDSWRFGSKTRCNSESVRKRPKTGPTSTSRRTTEKTQHCFESIEVEFCKQKIIVLHGNYSTDPNNVSSEVKSHIFSIGIGQCTFATFPRNCTICTHTHTNASVQNICVDERFWWHLHLWVVWEVPM